MSASTDTRPTRITHPGVLAAVRLVWLAVAVTSLATYVLGIPLLREFVYTLAEPEWTAALEQLGVSRDFYFAYTVVLGGIGFAVFSVAATLIFWRRWDDGMAAFVSIFLLGFGGALSPAINVLTYHELGAGWAASLFQGANFVSGWFAWPLLVPLVAVFPDGRFVPRWMRYIAAFGFSFSILWGFFPQEFAAPRGLLAVVVPLAGIIMLVPGIYAPIYRYRHVSTPSQRQQTKWFVLGLSLFIILQMTQVALSGSLPFFQQPGPATEMFTTFSTLTSVCIPLSIMVAILRYRLWDVDFVINRSLVYGGLTLLLGGAFAGGFFALRFALELFLGSGQAVLAAVAATFIVVALFNPARKWVQAFVDRGLYGIGIDYAQAARAKRAVPRVDTGDTRTNLGNYTGLELLGRGGMGEVYRAEHPTLKRPVAIKVLPTHLTGDPQATQRFVREAQTISRLSHRNIVALYDFGEHQGAPYMVMEYVNGRSLASLLKARGRLSLRDALPLLHDIAAALDYAHGQGIVHRDIKPANVMVEEQAESRRAILMDFGIAKLYEVTMQLTSTGGFVGTLDYIAPEQIQGAKEVDGRADVYSFGVMAYEALTGEKPFKHSNPGAMIMAHLMEPPPSPAKLVPELSDEIGEAVRQAMAKKPEERFITAGEFVGALG